MNGASKEFQNIWSWNFRKTEINAQIDLLLAEYCKKSFALMDNFGWRLIVMMLTFISL